MKLLLFLLAVPLAAQVVFKSPPKLYNSTTAPASCAVGEIWFKSDAAAGSNLYGCTATNTWTLLGSGSAPTVTDVYWPFGYQNGSEIAYNPGATVQKTYSFTPPFTMTFSKIGYVTSGTGYVAFAFSTFAGTAALTNGTANCSNGGGSGNGQLCSMAGTVTLTGGTTYRFTFTAAASTGLYTANGGSIAYNIGSGSGFPFSSTVAIGTTTATSTGSTTTLAVTFPLGTITGVTGSIAPNAYPLIVLIP